MQIKDKILLVDDTPSVLDMVRTILDTEGYQILIAASGESAIKKAELSLPSIILLDVMMPDLSGYEVCTILKSRESTKNIPIIFLSALADTFDKVKAFNLGAVDYITKPIQAEELLVRVSTHLTINRLQKSLRETNLVLEEKIKSRTIELEYANENLLSLNQVLEETVEQLNIAKNKAEESDKLKTAFLANMSHEIRTPMNAVIGFSELLNDADLEFDKRVEYINYINENANALLAVINDIIDLSHIEAGIIHTVNEKVNIKYILHELYNAFLLQAEAKKLKFNLIIESNADVIIESDSFRIKQIISKLLSNAIKFTQSGTIELGYNVAHNSALIFVRDTGIGIPKDLQNIIFEPFRQAEESYTRKYGGTGLGLTIANNYTIALGGKLSLDSESGKGTTFYLHFTISNNLENQTLNPNTGTSDYNWDHKTILIAEDEIVNYMYLTELLSKTHVKIIHALNGVDACNQVNENKEIDLILMDLKMPVMNGIEASKYIHQNFPDIPIIAQTAFAMSENRQNALDAGCVDYISKPIRKDSLLYLISNYINKKETA